MKLLVSALEPSANVHLKAVMEHMPQASLSGIFDPALGTPIVSPHEFGVMGFFDVISKIKKAKQAIKTLTQMAENVDRVLLIDAPAFNLPLAKAIKSAHPNVKIIYYILPKVWAWKKKRAKLIEAYTDVQISIFPFEDRFYPKSRYVGNPLMDEIARFKTSLTENETIAFLAGSRKSEIKRLMPVMRALQSRLAHFHAVLVIPPHLSDAAIEALYGDISMFEISRDTHQALYEASFAFVCSGTATLETALIGTPFLLLYKAQSLEFKIGRMLVKLPFVGLANIIFDFNGESPMHPEFLQNAIDIEAMLQAYESMDRAAFFKKSLRLRSMLGGGANEKVAQIIASSL